MLTIDDKAQPNSDVIVTELDDNEAVLLHLDSKLYFSLNETGLRIWKLLNQGSNLREISEQLYDEFDVSREKAEQCVITLANQLYAEQLVDIIND